MRAAPIARVNLKSPDSISLAKAEASNERALALIPLRTEGTEGPLFLVSSSSCISVRDLKALANAIDPRIPLYALSHLRVEVPYTIEGFAERFVRMVRAVQAHGPYRIVGWNHDNAVAYEAAIRLIGQDEAVTFLGLVDFIGTFPEVADERTGREPTTDALANYEPQRVPLPVHYFGSSKRSGSESDTFGNCQHLLSSCSVTQVVIACDDNARPEECLRELGVTISAILQTVDEPPIYSRGEHYDPLVMIQSSHRAAAPPVFCIPGAGDNAIAFLPFVEAIGRGWPLYALQARGLDGKRLPHTMVEIAANDCLRAIAKACPAGALHLVGHSFGGWVAFETALRLSAAGRRVTSLTIIDSEPPDEQYLIRELTHIEVLMYWLELVELDADRSLGIQRNELRSLDASAQLSLIHERMAAAGLLPPRSTPSVLEGPIRTFAAAVRTSYCPDAVYAGHVEFVYASDHRIDGFANAQRRDDVLEAWRKRAPDAEMWHGPGNHITILKPPNVAELAARWLKSATAL